jgi:hypothetical protein
MCAGPTHRFRWNYNSPIFLDQCEAGHGTWLDGGEVQEMETWETQQLLAEPAKEEIRERLTKARLESEAAMIPRLNDPSSRLSRWAHALRVLTLRLPYM